MRAVIHIGMPKAGSTSIQAWRGLNAADLAAEGVHVLPQAEAAGPDLALRRAVGHTALSIPGVRRRKALHGLKKSAQAHLEALHEQVEREVAALAQRGGTLFGSCEHLFKMTLPQIRGLDRFLARHFPDRRYLAYLREPVDWLVSCYSQALRAGFGTGFHAYMSGGDERLADVHGQLGLWRRAVGDRLQVRLLEPDFLTGGDLIADIAGVLGVPVRRRPDRANESFAADFVEFIREMNLRNGPEKPKGAAKAARQRVVQTLTRLSAGRPKLVASDAQARALWAVAGPHFDRIRAAHFPDRPILFRPRVRGEGVMPTPLTGPLRASIEAELAAELATEARNPP